MSQTGVSVNPTPLGRVLLRPRGYFEPQAAYGSMDLVLYGGDAYVARRDTAGATPANAGYWYRLTDVGTAEAARVLAEEARAASEGARAQGEAARVQAEAARQILYNEIRNAFESGALKGADGADGRDGRDGIIGADGKDGKDGKDGADASPWRFVADGNPVTVTPAGGRGIEVVADRDCTGWRSGKNLLDNNKASAYQAGAKLDPIPTGIRSTTTQAGSSRVAYIDIGALSYFAGKQLTIYADMRAGAGNTPRMNMVTSPSNYSVRNQFVLINASGSTTVTVPSTAGDTRLLVGFYSATTDSVVGEYADFVNLQLEVGTASTPYKPFVAMDAYPIAAGTPTVIPAISGDNHLYADNGAWLRVGYDRDSMALLNDLTASVSNTAAVAQVGGCVGGVALGVTAKAIAAQAGAGDPSPDNVRAIAGKSAVNVWRGKKNLLYGSAFRTYGPESNINTPGGSALIVTGLDAAKLKGWALTAIFAQWIEANLRPSTTYTFRATLKKSVAQNVDYPVLADATKRLRLYKAAGFTDFNLFSSTATMAVGDTITVGNTFTTPADLKDYHVLVYTERWLKETGGSVADFATLELSNIQLEAGSVATPYEPYAGHTYTAVLPEAAYGWAGAEDEIDWTRGELRKNTKPVTVNSSLTVSYSSSRPNDTRFESFHINPADVMLGVSKVTSSHFRYVGISQYTIADEFIGTHNTANRIVFSILKSRMPGWDDAWTSTQKIAAFKGWLDAEQAAGRPVQILHQIATPIITTFTPPPPIPALSGTNVVYADAGGETTVTGRMGGEGLLSRIEAIETAIAGI